jgi:hypothetical protein
MKFRTPFVLPAVLLGWPLLALSVGCSGEDTADPPTVLGEVDHALTITVEGGGSFAVGIAATPQTTAGSDMVPSGAKTLIAGAGAECNIGISSAVDSMKPLVALGLRLFGSGDPGQGPFLTVAPGRAPTADDITDRVEGLICVADKLTQIADAVGPISWKQVTALNRRLAETDASVAELGTKWTILPQSERDRFIARDLALHTLAAAIRLDAMPIAVGTTRATATQIYAWEAGLAAAPSTVTSSVVAARARGVDDGRVTRTKGAAASKGRLEFEAGLLRAASELLKRNIDTSVQADLAGAAAKRSKSLDPQISGAAAWGATDVYDSLAHAARVLGGRLEIGDSSAPVRWRDPACSGVGQNQLLDRGYAGGSAGRLLDPAISSAAQVAAIQMAQRAAIFVPPGALSNVDDATVVTDFGAQLLNVEAVARHEDPNTFPATEAGKSLLASVTADDAASRRAGNAVSRQLFVVGPDPVGTGKLVILGALAIGQPSTYGTTASALTPYGIGSVPRPIDPCVITRTCPDAATASPRVDAGTDAGRGDAGAGPQPAPTGPSRTFVTSFSLSLAQRRYMASVLDIQAGATQVNVGAPTGAESDGSCVLGVRNDGFVPLENELLQGSSSYEDSWQYYLAKAKEHAAKADELGNQLLAQRREMDSRMENANLKLAEYCGVTNVASQVTVTGGNVQAPADNAALESCFSTGKVDVLLFGSVPQTPEGRQSVAQRVFSDLDCSANNSQDLCRRLAQELAMPPVQAVVIRSLGLSDQGLPPSLTVATCGVPENSPYRGDQPPTPRDEVATHLDRALRGRGLDGRAFVDDGVAGGWGRFGDWTRILGALKDPLIVKRS